MKNALLSLLILAISPCATAGEDALIAAIDREVWRPYVEGVNKDRPEMYRAVHSADFYWVAPGESGLIMDLGQYDADSRKVMKQRAKDGLRTELAVRFLERNVRADFAAEKVITKWKLRSKDGSVKTGYGIAHVFLRKEKSGWKIWLRYGSTERGSAKLWKSARKS